MTVNYTLERRGINLNKTHGKIEIAQHWNISVNTVSKYINFAQNKTYKRRKTQFGERIIKDEYTKTDMSICFNGVFSIHKRQ